MSIQLKKEQEKFQEKMCSGILVFLLTFNAHVTPVSQVMQNVQSYLRSVKFLKII